MPPWYTHGFRTEVFLSYSQLIKALHTSLSTNQTFPFVSDNSRTFVYSSKNLTAFEHLKGLVTYRRKSWTFSIYSYIGYLHDSWIINRWRGDNAFHLPQVFHTFHIHPHFSTDTSLQCQIMNCIRMCYCEKFYLVDWVLFWWRESREWEIWIPELWLPGSIKTACWLLVDYLVFSLILSVSRTLFFSS